MTVVAKHARPADGWRMARFDELFSRIERKVILADSASYDCVGVRWYGKGAFVREHLLGINISRKKQWIIKAGDIVYNKLFAWKGAFAIADNSVDGCIVSDKFPTYEANDAVIYPPFLSYYFRTPTLAKQAEGLSKGAAAISKLTLNPPQFWDLRIPLPPLEEQRRIAALIRKLVDKIEEARDQRRQGAGQTKGLVAARITQKVEGIPFDGCLNDILLEKPRNGWSARCDNAEAGIPVLSLGAVTGFRYRESEFKRTSEPTSPHAHYWLRDGDILITRSNTPELVGHAAIYNGSPNPCIYPDLMMRLCVDEKRADKRFAHYWLRSIPVREYIGHAAKGTSPTMKKLSQGAVTNIPFPARLSVPEQRRIVAYLDDLQAKVDMLEQLQAETATEIDALFPSILDKAFKGELRIADGLQKALSLISSD